MFFHFNIRLVNDVHCSLEDALKAIIQSEHYLLLIFVFFFFFSRVRKKIAYVNFKTNLQFFFTGFFFFFNGECRKYSWIFIGIENANDYDKQTNRQKCIGKCCEELRSKF